MPNRDRTGPRGQGPMTGRGLGPCGSGRAAPGYGRGAAYGRGFGFGRGLALRQGYGRGYGAFPAAQPSSSDQEKQILQQELEAIKNRLDQLED